MTRRFRKTSWKTSQEGKVNYPQGFRGGAPHQRLVSGKTLRSESRHGIEGADELPRSTDFGEKVRKMRKWGTPAFSSVRLSCRLRRQGPHLLIFPCSPWRCPQWSGNVCGMNKSRVVGEEGGDERQRGEKEQKKNE